MQNKILLAIGAILVLLGIFQPDLGNLVKPVPSVVGVESYVTDAPSDTTLLEKARVVSDILQDSDDSTRNSDALKLSCLYADMATLIELDGEDQVIKNTNAIREVNSIAGKMLRLDIKDKYPNLAEAAQELVVAAVGNDDVVLDDSLRSKSAEAFRALSWAFYQGSK
tara:strand:+ start:332 stop:832 length:501 start_codon:yes stop_codon:yes gene_type:complete